MRKTLSMLLLITLPVAALASGDHPGSMHMQGHQMQRDDMAGMEQGMGGATQDAMLGKPGDPAMVDRTIEITMDDSMRYTPSDISVKSGETIRFFLRNLGKMPHELVLGSMDELKEHAEMMRKMPNMQHADPNMMRLGPGQRGGLIWQFDKTGTVNFACMMPGHMEAGMMGKVEVQ